MANNPVTRPPRIADLSADDRPREKAIKHGIRSLTDTELMAIVLGSGTTVMPVTELSRQILNASGDKLTNVARLSIQEMCKKYLGIGPVKAVRLAAAFELGRRCATEQPVELPAVRCSSDIYNYIRTDIELLDYEEFWVILLSRSNRIIGKFNLSAGGTTATVVDVKLLVKHVVDRLAAGIAVVHNHPSGNFNPSGADDNLTSKIKGACDLFDVRLIDHLIITSSGYYSYADNGRL